MSCSSDRKPHEPCHRITCSRLWRISHLSHFLSYSKKCQNFLHCVFDCRQHTCWWITLCFNVNGSASPACKQCNMDACLVTLHSGLCALINAYSYYLRRQKLFMFYKDNNVVVQQMHLSDMFLFLIAVLLLVSFLALFGTTWQNCVCSFVCLPRDMLFYRLS